MIPEFIDIHAHVNFPAYDADREEVVSRTLEKKTWMINVGTQKDTSISAINLAEKYKDGVYAVIGLHPVHTGKSFHDINEIAEQNKIFTENGEVFDKDEYRKLLNHPKVVALGECGLDYFHLNDDSVKKQKQAFIEQIELANEVGKPLMLHIRSGKGGASAYKDAYEILKSHAKVKGDVHFFAGTWEEAKLFIDIGFTLSFTGVITFARDYDEVIRKTPLDMIMAETDCPYVSPAKYRGKRNEPLYVQEVVKRIADIRGDDLDVIKKALVDNARRVFDVA